MRHNMEENHLDQDNSELRKWLRINGKDTVEMFKELEESNFKKVLTFSGTKTNLEFETSNHITIYQFGLFFKNIRM